MAGGLHGRQQHTGNMDRFMKHWERGIARMVWAGLRGCISWAALLQGTGLHISSAARGWPVPRLTVGRAHAHVA